MNNLQPKLGEVTTLSIDELDRTISNSPSIINCGYIVQAATLDEPYWKLSYTKED